METQEEKVHYIVSINGKTIFGMEVPFDHIEKDIVQKAQEHQEYLTSLKNREVKKIVFIKDKLINFVLAS